MRSERSGGFSQADSPALYTSITRQAARMRVALDMTFPRRHQGGANVYAFALLEALRACDVLTVDQITASEGAGKLSTLAWLMGGVNRAIDRHEVDLLHCPAFVAPVTPQSSKTRLIITIHDSAALRFPHDYPLDWQLYNRFLLPRLARAADRIITVSETARADIARDYGLDPSLICVTYEGVDSRFCHADTRKREWTQCQISNMSGVGGPRPDDPLILFVGAPLRRKNLDLLLDILAGSSPESALSRATLAITGATAAQFPHYDRQIRDRRLSSRVRWLGQVPDERMPALYAEADLLVYPSLYEGFGLPPLEAMAVGTPIVASRAGALPEILSEAALFADPADQREFSEAIESVLTQPALVSRLVERGRRRVARYSWRRCAEATAAVYAQALKAPPRARRGADPWGGN